ncbi:hypothetical protein TA3x_003779 [Tundrisphaera sp. TA3]|uniref:hypothetical protein n=1 Tax=Tundrisphaera sp. TA3 TaxID=3435775 RepID=UPI003EBC6443
MPRQKAILLLFIGLFGCCAGFVFVARIVVESIQGEPYQMMLRNADGRAVVQFSQPDRGLVSPEFPIDIPIETPRVAVLRSERLDVPGCEVEFFDPTILPGRFQIRIGKVLFDVMPARIVVDDVDHGWKPH